MGQICDDRGAVPTCVDMLASADAMPDGTIVDAPPDAPPGLGLWGPPAIVSISMAGDDDPTLTADLLEMHFDRSGDIYVTSRPAVTAAWVMPVLVTELSSAMGGETLPEIALDGLTIYFTSTRSGTPEIWTSTRSSRTAAWVVPVLVPSLNSTADDAAGAPSADGLEITLASTRGGASYDIYTSTRPTVASAWSMPVSVVAINSAFQDESPFFGDPLTLYFDADRLGTGDYDIYVSRRPSATEAFGAPEAITELATTASDWDPWVSPDGREMFFSSERSGPSQLYRASR